MRVQSIWTAIEVRNPARDGFLGSARQVAFGKMDRIAELHHVAQKVRPVAEALQNAGHLRATRLGAPLFVHLGHIAGGVRIFDDVDLGRLVGHRVAAAIGKKNITAKIGESPPKG